jgi:hypothetical protein
MKQSNWEQQLLLSQSWKSDDKIGSNDQFERVPKIISYFGGTNNIFVNCIVVVEVISWVESGKRNYPLNDNIGQANLDNNTIITYIKKYNIISNKSTYEITHTDFVKYHQHMT